MTLDCDPNNGRYAQLSDVGAATEVSAEALRLLEQMSGCLDGERPTDLRTLGDFQRWLESLPVIEQAKGILMGHFLIDADTAFATLRRWSAHHNIRISAISQQLTATTGNRSGGSGSGADKSGADKSGADGSALAALLTLLDGPPIDPD